MAGFAKLGLNGEVLEVVAVDNSVITDSNGNILKNSFDLKVLLKNTNWKKIKK